MPDLVCAWNDRTARMEVIGISIWDGKSGLLPEYATKPDLEMAKRASKRAAGTICACGGPKRSTSAQCEECGKARKKLCPQCGWQQIARSSPACRSCTKRLYHQRRKAAA